MSDIAPMLKKIEKIIKEEIGGNPAVVLTFTTPPDYKNVQYVANCSKADAVRLLGSTADTILSGM